MSRRFWLCRDGEAQLSFGSTGSGRLVYAKPFGSAPKAILGGYMDFSYTNTFHKASIDNGYSNITGGGIHSSYDQQRFRAIYLCRYYGACQQLLLSLPHIQLPKLFAIVHSFYLAHQMLPFTIRDESSCRSSDCSLIAENTTSY
ncbi:hypothetical protein [Nitrospira sp. Nam74]